MPIETTPNTVPECPRHPGRFVVQEPCPRQTLHPAHHHSHSTDYDSWCPGV